MKKYLIAILLCCSSAFAVNDLAKNEVTSIADRYYKQIIGVWRYNPMRARIFYPDGTWQMSPTTGSGGGYWRVNGNTFTLFYKDIPSAESFTEHYIIVSIDHDEWIYKDALHTYHDLRDQ